MSVVCVRLCPSSVSAVGVLRLEMAAAIAHTIIGIRTRIAGLWPVHIADDDALAVGICCCLNRAHETVDVVCDRNLARVIKKNLEIVAMNDDELGTVIEFLASKSIDAAALESIEWFKSQRGRIEDALRCTLSENRQADSWKRPSVQMACVLAFNCTENPILKLDRVLSSVVKSDTRRVDDVHFECLEKPPDPFSLSVCLGVVTSAIL